jgi:hypothetical protein
MAIWLDQKQEASFNGILVVMNPTGIGDLSLEEREVVGNAAKSALASGWAIVRMYDKGVEPAPDWMDDIEDHCFGRTPSWMNAKKACHITHESKKYILEQMPNARGPVMYVGLLEDNGRVEFVVPTKV